MSCLLSYLFSFFSYKIREQEGREVLPREEGLHQWEARCVEERKWESEYCAIKCVHMFLKKAF
jgi:hypothetical protein